MLILELQFCDYNFVGRSKEECSSAVDEQRRQHRASAWIQVLSLSFFGASMVGCAKIYTKYKGLSLSELNKITC
jgi:hypothetical protein